MHRAISVYEWVARRIHGVINLLFKLECGLACQQALMVTYARQTYSFSSETSEPCSDINKSASGKPKTSIINIPAFRVVVCSGITIAR